MYTQGMRMDMDMSMVQRMAVPQAIADRSREAHAAEGALHSMLFVFQGETVLHYFPTSELYRAD
jgi:hypothetical protein